jgi:hypothetical protein
MWYTDGDNAGDTYEGEWKDGHRHGQGTLWYNDGEIYKGEFKNDEVKDP